MFIPIAVESLCAWHSSAIAEMKKLGSALARHSGEDEGTTISCLFQRLSICLMRGNAALFNNWCPPDQLLAEAEVLKLGYKFDFRFFQLKLEAFSLSLYRFAALARRQLVPGSVRFWGRVEVRLLIICFLLIVWSRILGDASLFSNFTGFTGGLNLKLRFPLRKAGCSVRGTFPPSFPIPGWLTSSTG